MFEIRASLEWTGVERARDTKFAVSTGSPGGYVTQSGASHSEPISSPHLLFRCPRHPPLFPLVYASPRTSPRYLAPALPRSIRLTIRVPNWSHILVISCSQGNPTSHAFR
jgi:hypothetical protein